MRAKVNATIWQAVAQSGVDVSALSQKEMDKLVEAITGGVLREVDNLLEEAAGSLTSLDEQGDDDDSEEILWEGRPYLSISVSYQITSERVRIIQGMFGKERRDIELVRVQDVDHKQNVAERTLNMGDVYIRSSDVSDPEVVLNNVTNPQEVHEILRKAVLKARKKHNMSFREEM
jgi:hypothetical protein